MSEEVTASAGAASGEASAEEHGETQERVQPDHSAPQPEETPQLLVAARQARVDKLRAALEAAEAALAEAVAEAEGA